MLAYLGFDETRRPARYFCALALFALALLAKSITVTLPAAVLVILWWQRGTLSWRHDALPLAPFFALGIASGLVTIEVERAYFHPDWAELALNPAQRILLAGRAIWFYVGKLAWPDVTFEYPRWALEPAEWWQWIFPVGVLATTLALWAIRNRSRAPLAGWLLFCGTLLPVLGFLNIHYFIYSFVADHFQYLASLAMIVLVAAGIGLMLRRMPPVARGIGGALCVFLVGGLAALTARQSYMYADEITLYKATIDRNPDCWLAQNNLATALLAQGDRQGAIDHCRETVRLRPNFFGSHVNLGNALLTADRLPEAVDELRIAVALNPDDPAALNTLGAALLRSGQNAEAAQHFEHALQLRPDDALANYNMGVLLSYTDKTKEAITYYERAVRLLPDYAHAHNALANALQQAGRHKEAIEHFQTALRLEPSFVAVYPNLVQALAQADQSREAISAARKWIEVARASGDEASAQQMEEWLGHYRTELRRAAEAAPADSPAHASEPAHSQ